MKNTAVHVLAPVFALALLPLAGCGDGDTTETEPPPDEQVPPAWTDAPTASVPLGQGQTSALPMTLTGEAGVTAAVTPPPELEAEVAASQPPELVLHAPYTTAGPVTLLVDVTDAEGTRVSYPVNVEVRPLEWKDSFEWDVPTGPEAREHGAMVLDEPGGQAFLIGGTGYSPYGELFDDVWRYDIASGAWFDVTPTGDVPAGGGSRRVAQSADPAVAYLFGGYGTNGAANAELYRVRVEGSTLSFQLLEQQGTPAKRALHAFAYDAQTDRFVMFGGTGATAPLGDTWTMKLMGDTAVWTKLAPAVSPSGRYGFFYGVDSAAGKLYLFSGAQSYAAPQLDAARDTWVLDMRAEPPTWELLLEGEAAPPGRRNGCMVFDPSGPRLFVLGGTPDAMKSEPGLWVFDARPGKAKWDLIERAGEPPIRSSGFGFHDTATQRTFLGFGNTTSAVYSDWNVLGH